MRTITRFVAAILAAIGLSAPLVAAPKAFWTDFSKPSYTTSGGKVFLLGDYTLTMPGSYDSATKTFTLTGAATITKGGTALSEFTLMAEVSNLSGAAADGRILSFGTGATTGWLKFFSTNGVLKLGYNNENPYTDTDLSWVSTGDRAVVSIDHIYANGTTACVNGTGKTKGGLRWQNNTYSTFGVGYSGVKVHSIWLHETRLGNATTVGNEVTRFQTAATGATGIALADGKPTDANYTGNINTGDASRGQVTVRQNSWVNYKNGGNVGATGTAGLTATSVDGSTRYNVLLTTGDFSNLSGNAWVEGTSSFTVSNGVQMTVNGISDVASMNLRSGRWTGSPDKFVADTIYVLGGQLWPGAAGTIPAKVVLGTSTYSEGNAYGGAGLRADANITVPELHVIEAAKITQGGGNTLTLARLTGSGNLTFAVYNGTPGLTVQGATDYTGVLTKPNGTTTLAPNSTFGGELTQAAGTIALAGGGQTIAKLNATGALSLTQTDGTLTLNALAGSGAVTFSGSGTPSLAINGATDYTGVLTKPNGITTLASGSTFNGELNQAVGTVQLAGTGGHTVKKLTATGNLALTLLSNAESIRETFGGIQVSGSNTVLTLSQASWNNFISVGTLEGEGTLTWNQTTNHYTPSTLTISGDNTGFAGSIETVRTSGGNNDRPYQQYLVAASNTALGSANLYLNGANATNYSSLAVNANTVTVGTLRGTAYAYVLSGLAEPTANSGGARRSGDGTTRTLKLIGAQDGTWLGEIGANVNIEKAGTGTWTVGDGNLGTGTVTLTEGILAMPLQSAQRTITSNGGTLRFVLTDAQVLTLNEQTTNVVWDGDVGAVQVQDEQGQTVAATVTKSDANVLSLQVQEVFTRTVADGGTADYSDALWTNSSTSETGSLTEGAEVALTLSGDATLVVPSTTTDLSKLHVFLADGVSTATLTVRSEAAPNEVEWETVTEAVAASWSQTLPTRLATGITCQGAYAAEGYRSAWYDNKVYVAKVPTTRSVSVKIGARTATDGSIYPKHDSVGAYPVQGMFWNQAPLYNINTSSDGSYKGVMNVQDASGSSSMQFAYYGPNTYFNNTATVGGSTNARTTGNGELTYTYVDDAGVSPGTKTVTTGNLSATLPAAPNNFGWMVQLSDIPYDAYDLYFITASDANDTALHECPIYVTLNGGTTWSPYYGTYSAEAGGKTVAGATNWDGLPFGDGVLTEGRNYLKIRISKSLFGENISTISVTHGARNTGSNIRSGLAAIQVVEVTNDGVYTREENESTDWFASAWTVGSVANQSWVNATNETPSYAKINPAVVSALELTQDVAATSMVVAGSGDLTLSGTGALSAPILDATGLTGTLTLANTGALSAGVTLGSEATLALSTETERTYTAAELSLSGSGKLGKAGAGTAKLEFPVTRPVSVTAGKLELPGTWVAGSTSAEGTTLSVAGDATLTATDSANLLGTLELRSGTLTAKADTFVTPITVLGGTLLTGGNSASAVYGIFTKPITVGGGTAEAKVRLTDWHASANFQGGLTLRNKGYLQMEASGTSGAYVKGAVTVDAPAGDVYIGGASMGAYTMESAITGVGRLHLIQSAGTNAYTLSGVIADKSAGEPLQVIVDGGTVALTGTNTYTGGTVLNSNLTAAGASIGPGNITVNEAVTLTLSSGVLTVASGKTLAGAGNIAGAVTFADGAVLDVTAGAPTVTGEVTASDTVRVVLPEGSVLQRVLTTATTDLESAFSADGYTFSYRDGAYWATLTAAKSLTATVTANSTLTALTWTRTDGVEIDAATREQLFALPEVMATLNTTTAAAVTIDCATVPALTLSGSAAVTLSAANEVTPTIASLTVSADSTVAADLLNHVTGATTVEANKTLTLSGTDVSLTKLPTGTGSVKIPVGSSVTYTNGENAYSGRTTVEGELTLACALSFTQDGSANPTYPIDIAQGGTVTLANGASTYRSFRGAGDLVVTGTNAVLGIPSSASVVGGFAVTGNVRVNSDATLKVTSWTSNAVLSGANLQVDGQVSKGQNEFSLEVAANKTLSGSGTINVPVTFETGGLLDVSQGVLGVSSVTGTVTLRGYTAAVQPVLYTTQADVAFAAISGYTVPWKQGYYWLVKDTAKVLSAVAPAGGSATAWSALPWKSSDNQDVSPNIFALGLNLTANVSASADMTYVALDMAATPCSTIDLTLSGSNRVVFYEGEGTETAEAAFKSLTVAGSAIVEIAALNHVRGDVTVSGWLYPLDSGETVTPLTKPLTGDGTVAVFQNKAVTIASTLGSVTNDEATFQGNLAVASGATLTLTSTIRQKVLGSIICLDTGRLVIGDGSQALGLVFTGRFGTGETSTFGGTLAISKNSYFTFASTSATTVTGAVVQGTSGMGRLTVGDGTAASTLTVTGTLGTVADGVATYAGAIEVAAASELRLQPTLATTLSASVTGAGKVVIGNGTSATKVTQAAAGCDISAIDIAAGATYTVNSAGTQSVMLPATTTVSIVEGGKLQVDTARQMNANVTGAGEVEVNAAAKYVFAAGQRNRLAPGKLTLKSGLVLHAARGDNTGLSVNELTLKSATLSMELAESVTTKPAVTVAANQVLSGYGSITVPIVFKDGAIFDAKDSTAYDAATDSMVDYSLKLTGADITWPESGTVTIKASKPFQLIQFNSTVGLSHFTLVNTGEDTGLYLYEGAYGATSMLNVLKEIAESSLPPEISKNTGVKNAIKAAIEKWTASDILITEVTAAVAKNTAGKVMGSAQAVDCFTNLETTLELVPDWEKDHTKATAVVTYDFGVADMTIKSLQLSGNDPATMYVLLAAKVQNSADSNTASFATGTELTVLNGEKEIIPTSVTAAQAGAVAETGVQWLAVPLKTLFPDNAPTGTQSLKVKAKNTTTTP